MHSTFAPSKAHQWIYCPLSLRLEEKANIKELPSSQADEGTIAHKRFSSILKSHYKHELFSDNVEVVADISDPLVNKMAQFVINTYPKPQMTVISEMELVYDKDLSGTPDVIVLEKDPDTNAEKVRAIIDLKYGDVDVEVYSNPQLLMYAWLTSKLLGNEETVDLIILQPKSENPIKIWSIGALQLRVFEDQVNQSLDFYYGRPTIHRGFPLRQSEEICKYCKVRYSTCPLTLNAIDVTHKDLVSQKDLKDVQITKEQEIFLLKHRTKIINYLEQLHNSYKERLQNGEVIEGLRLTKDREYKNWDLDFKNDIEKLLQLNSINPYTTTLKSPAQVLKEKKDLDLTGLLKIEKKGSYITEGE